MENKITTACYIKQPYSYVRTTTSLLYYKPLEIKSLKCSSNMVDLR